MKYSEKLRKILISGALTQENLASKIGVSFSTINSWLNGKSSPTRLELKKKIDEVFIQMIGVDEIDIENLKKIKQEVFSRKFSIKKIVSNKDLLDKLTLNLTYHTNTIEGSTMTFKDVKNVIFDSKILSNRTLIEQREAINHQVAMNFLIDELNKNKKLRFTPGFIQKIHLILMNGIISNAGLWRNHSVRILGANVPLANYMKIPDLTKKLCDELNKENKDPISLLAKTHSKFEQIHPFSDGNGRTGRLIMFIKAVQLEIFPPIILKEQKSAYYKYLEISQIHDNFDFLENFITETIIVNYDNLDID